MLYLFFLLIIEVFLILFAMGAESAGMAGFMNMSEDTFAKIPIVLFVVFVVTLLALLFSTQKMTKKEYV